MKKHGRKMMWLAVAALSATLTASAPAQYQINADGRARDANNRIGGAGYNDSNNFWQGRAYGYQGNSIVTGNVTGGREFRGFVPYSDPGAFRGTTAGSNMDRFIRSSSAAPFGGNASNNAQVVQPFYGVSRAAPPPPGFVQQAPGSGAYVPPRVMTPDPGDLRLGVTSAAPQSALPLPGQLLMPGPVNPNTQTNSFITASPLYGVRKWDLGAESDQLFLSNMMGPASNSALARTDPATLQRLRQELLTPGPIDQRIDATGTVNPTGTDAPPNPQLLNDALQAPFESPQNKPLGESSVLRSTQTSADAALNASVTTGAGVRQRLLTAQQQSTQYNELTRRLQQHRVVQEMAEAQTQREIQRRMQAAGQQPTTPGDAAAGGITDGGMTGGGMTGGATGGLPAVPGAGATPGLPGAGQGAQPTFPGAGTGGPTAGGTGTTPPPTDIQIPGSMDSTPVVPRPVQIKSLAEGVQTQGLTDLLKQAEDQLKAGRYNSALEQYDVAEQVAPNNPLILMGRANVELARTYYTRAETHLRQAFMSDQALLMGQYDLRSMIGNERLEVLVKDLKDITNREQKEARPAFLLAYIAYNTGNERMAAAYLDLAEKRAGANDPLYPLIRKHWSLPKGATEDMTK